MALVDGRHHLTLRSAVAVENNTGRPLEVWARPLDLQRSVAMDPSAGDAAGDAAGSPGSPGATGAGLGWRLVLGPCESASLPLAVVQTKVCALRVNCSCPPN